MGEKRTTAKLKRREFIKLAGSFAGALTGTSRGYGAWMATSRRVSIIIDPGDAVANHALARWAATELEQALRAGGAQVQMCQRLSQAGANDLSIVAAGSKSPLAAGLMKKTAAVCGEGPEALALLASNLQGRKALLACGSDPRGLIYALLELSDRVKHGSDPILALQLENPIVEQPSNSVRGVMRLFASDIEDKPWYYDREMWPQYLTMLATQRFNRFNLSLGLGYDFLRRVADAYFLFAYPFLVSVPGYTVRAEGLPDAERSRNLETLKFISEQTVARGLQFHLGLWMHGYEWIDSPNANYTIKGLTRAAHAAYCRDALRLLLQTCPAIGGVTLRTHGESGIEEGSYDFWRTVFDGVATCGRRVEIDLHPKGLDQTMLDNALRTRQPVTVSPKFWAEHLGMPYHQADIRELEVPAKGKQTSGLMNLSEGSRSFMRYGYGDLLREDRSWSVIHRVWPGSQRILAWGDPSAAAAYSTAFRFCGSNGAEIMEPLSFMGRRGSGIAGGRTAYADTSLVPRWDWQKYEYTYRVWGRLLYNSESDPDPWRRYLRAHLGMAAGNLESALASASRVLPIITTAHLPSAANNNYWPEMYTNQSLIDAAHPGSYSDTPSPKVFGNVSPLDPQLFSRINDFADELLGGQMGGKYSPLEVAAWLDGFADAAYRHLGLGAGSASDHQQPPYRRLAVDISIQAGLGRFFAAKFRAAVLYRIFEKTGERAALQSSIEQYRLARAAWLELSRSAEGVYLKDIGVGELPQLHGHWLDRLPAIDRDINRLAEQLDPVESAHPQSSVTPIIHEVLSSSTARPVLKCRHVPPSRFSPEQPLEIQLLVEEPVASVSLYYRHVDQAERFNVTRMHLDGPKCYATIPAAYTRTHYPLQYYFEVKTTAGWALLWPGFSKELTNQPYFVIRPQRADHIKQ